MAAREIVPGVFAVGAIDWDRRIFDELIPLPDGTTYNSYLVQGRSLAITPPSGTSQLCGEPQGIMEQEAAFLNALVSAGSYNMEAGELFILDAAGRAVLEFVRRDR